MLEQAERMYQEAERLSERKQDAVRLQARQVNENSLQTVGKPMTEEERQRAYERMYMVAEDQQRWRMEAQAMQAAHAAEMRNLAHRPHQHRAPPAAPAAPHPERPSRWRTRRRRCSSTAMA